MVEKNTTKLDAARERLERLKRDKARLPSDPQLKAAALQLRELLKAEDQMAKAKERGESSFIDWTNIEDARAYRRDFKRAARATQLDSLVPDRRCPRCCEGPVMKSRSWIIIWDESRGIPFKAICRSCYTHLMHEAKEEALKYSGSGGLTNSELVDAIFKKLGGIHFESDNITT